MTQPPTDNASADAVTEKRVRLNRNMKAKLRDSYLGDGGSYVNPRTPALRTFNALAQAGLMVADPDHSSDSLVYFALTEKGREVASLLSPELDSYAVRRREHFWERIDKTDGCWNWTGALTRQGYGVVYVHKHKTPAHRYSWEVFNGEIPPGMFVCHHCDNRRCVNPAHLFLGTAKDNMQDMVKKRRHYMHLHPEASSFKRPEFAKHRAKGESINTAKLNADQVRELRQLHSQGESPTKLALRFGISRTAFYDIVNRLHWKHID